ncbi:hypothetical protein AND_003353 [Anopheles darlingi]|uniref:Zinc transporter foi n=1 Tax=Anopheles darlingi TaxID=43151 RepID=W5JLA7_ANODA|nr:zinc transporter foi [Anopheles darlingi]XP_049545697.1 zinc transporter foi [Anopheles darlingi]XP_049545698.1 zinc transporter foi [Anopheles darlingi]ETN64891.1 hypothetical protein AND_003353 [Anopheles darlingi]
MARHIMAVCVVCLLCADHVRCKQHFSGVDQASSVERIKYDRTINPAIDHEQRWLPYGEYDTSLHQRQEETNGDHRIVKRHSHHNHAAEEKKHGDEEDQREEFERKLNPMVKEFVMKIFAEFGNPETMQMDGKGFERMIDRLGLYQMIGGEVGAKITTSSVSATDSDRQQKDPNKCLSSAEFLKRVTTVKVPSEEWHKEEYTASKDSEADNATQQHNSSDHSIQSNTSVNNESNSNTNSSNNDHPIDDHHHHHEEESSENTANNASQQTNGGISRFDSRDLYNICPLILSRLLAEDPLARAGCFTPDSVPELQTSSSHHIHHHDSEHSHELAVWVYSFLAILGVSLCGLLGVVVIPCMDKHFYHHALQFLVALAVGTLCGDALLHLLPHAMFPDGLSLENAHDQMMYKGLASVFGIVFFYFMERLLTMIAEWYKGREKKDKPSSRVRVMRDPESNSLHLAAGSGEKQCKHKYSAYPYCYDEIAMDTKDDHHEHNQVNENHNNVLAKCANSHGDEQQQQQQHQGNEHIPLNHNNSTSSVANNHRHGGTSHDETIHTTSNSIDNNTVSSNLDDGSIESGEPQTVIPLKTEATKKLRKENYTIILREHETKHHGHSHTHGHVHSPPGSLSAVVWMVIMGDGLHNFTDGMTIGAAFANNIAGGFSTAIAVFCHELPHELGDFAVLLKAGMSAREAVFYNLLSSVLSIFGMILGIMVGHQPQASAWIFALAAGMFLYIAMVDMIPELTSSHGAEERCKLSDFGLQLLGLVVGFGIMLLIAIYEHDLMEIFVH